MIRAISTPGRTAHLLVDCDPSESVNTNKNIKIGETNLIKEQTNRVFKESTVKME